MAISAADRAMLSRAVGRTTATTSGPPPPPTPTGPVPMKTGANAIRPQDMPTYAADMRRNGLQPVPAQTLAMSQFTEERPRTPLPPAQAAAQTARLQARAPLAGPTPAAPAYANANANAAFQRPTGTGAEPPRNQAQLNQILRSQQTPGGAQDMVEVPGFGPMPRALLGALAQRLAARQQAPVARTLPAPAPNIGAIEPWRPGPGAPTGNAPVGVPFGDIATLQAERDRIRAALQSGQISPQDAQRRIALLQQQRQQVAGGPPVRTMANDNVGVGVPGGSGEGFEPWLGYPGGYDAWRNRPGGPNQPVTTPAPPPTTPPPAPPPAPAAGPSPTPTSPEPGGVTGRHYWNAQTGQWVPTNNAPVLPGGGPPPPPAWPSGYAPGMSPFAGHVAGGGPEAMGAGRNPLAASMGSFYDVYGNGVPGQRVPTQQELYDRFNGNYGNYGGAGVLTNGAPSVMPSWW